MADASAAAAPAGLRTLADAHDVLVCDVFGVLHDADGPFPAATAALAAFRARGGTVVLASNAAEAAARLAESLAARGVAPAYDALVTAADISRDWLRAHRPRAMLHIGAERERALFAGLDLVPVERAEVVVCTGYPRPDDDLDAVLDVAAARRLALLCTNPDTELIVGGRRLRFAGLVAERYRARGGTVVETGKPGPAIYRAALALAAAARGCDTPPERVLGIGDTPALDVAGALAQGFAALQIGGAPAPSSLSSDRLHRMPALVW